MDSGKGDAGNREPIRLSAQAIDVLNDAQRQLAEVQGQTKSYVSGLRHGLNVPDDWQLDMKAKAFVPPGTTGQKRDRPDQKAEGKQSDSPAEGL